MPPAPEGFDRVLLEVGSFGRYQLMLFLPILGPILSCAVSSSQYIFNAADLNYRCLVPECESPPSRWDAGAGSWASWALPPDARCHRRVPRAVNASESCLPASFENDTLQCDQWVYQTNHTIVAEFNLACHDWKRAIVGTVHHCGKFSVLFILGMISDKYGRKKTFVTAVVAGATMAIIRSFSTNFPTYLVFEFLDASFDAGVYSTGFVLALEMIGPEKRVIGGCVLSVTFSLGQVLLALVARQWPYWRTLTRITYAPSYIYLSYYFLLEESVRWLTVNGKTEAAIKILRKVAASNGKKINEEHLRAMLKSVAPSPREEQVSVCHQVLHSKILITRVLICSFCWCSMTFVYYGMSINSVSLAGDMYVNFILTSLAEIPGYTLGVFTLDRFGRKRSIIASLLICMFTLLVSPFLSTELSALALALFLMGKAMVSLGVSCMYIMALELFPTRARSSLMNACSTVARFGSMAAPLSPLLMSVSPMAPLLMFGALSGLSALLLMLMPETLLTDLPDTVRQAERISVANFAAPPTPEASENSPPAAATDDPGGSRDADAGARGKDKW